MFGSAHEIIVHNDILITVTGFKRIGSAHEMIEHNNILITVTGLERNSLSTNILLGLEFQG